MTENDSGVRLAFVILFMGIVHRGLWITSDVMLRIDTIARVGNVSLFKCQDSSFGQFNWRISSLPMIYVHFESARVISILKSSKYALPDFA